MQRVNGVNLTFWKAADEANPNARLHGLQVGIVGPEGAYLRGVNLGLGAVASREMAGVNVGVFGLVSQGGVTVSTSADSAW